MALSRQRTVTRALVGLDRLRTSGTPAWVAFAYAGALAFVFLGERVFPTLGWLRAALTGLGAVAAVALTVLRWIAVRAAGGDLRALERALAILSTLGLLALLLLLTTVDLLERQLGLTRLATDTRNRYEAGATAAGVALLLAAIAGTFFAERALYPMRRAATVEWRRVRDATAAGLTLALAATYGSLFCFVAGELDVKADFSYFQTARPSESTRKIAESATEDIRVLAFFPEVNDVGRAVGGYLADLARAAPRLRVEQRDRLLVPQMAKDAKVNEDGVIVLERGGQRETLSIGTEMQKARPKLKTLDADFQKTLLKLMREKRTAYFTVGHAELNDAQPTQQNEGRTGKDVREILGQQNYTVHDTSTATGFGVDAPEDATLLVVLGPRQPFLPEELQSLRRYLDHGGRLLLCLDPEPKADLAQLASLVGLTVSTAVLADDKVHIRRRFNDSDRVILATNRFSSHASVSTLSRLASRPVLFLGAAALDKKTDADPALKIDFAIRALPDTFDDQNGNFAFDAPAEKRSTYALAAAVSKSVMPPTDGSRKRSDEMRAFVIGDADAVSDAAFSNEANVLLVADAVRWLTGEESFAGMLATPEDVRIEHTKQKDLVWFYGTIFVAPAIVLGGGLVYTRRGRRTSTTTKAKAKQPKEAA
jgi:hypothetical protein